LLPSSQHTIHLAGMWTALYPLWRDNRGRHNAHTHTHTQARWNGPRPLLWGAALFYPRTCPIRQLFFRNRTDVLGEAWPTATYLHSLQRLGFFFTPTATCIYSLPRGIDMIMPPILGVKSRAAELLCVFRRLTEFETSPAQFQSKIVTTLLARARRERERGPEPLLLLFFAPFLVCGPSRTHLLWGAMSYPPYGRGGSSEKKTLMITE
jgi:hypothetical protein